MHRVEEKMRIFIRDFFLGLGSDMLVGEPLIVLSLVMLPFIFDNAFCANLREAARELGLL